MSGLGRRQPFHLSSVHVLSRRPTVVTRLSPTPYSASREADETRRRIGCTPGGSVLPTGRPSRLRKGDSLLTMKSMSSPYLSPRSHTASGPDRGG